MSLKNCPECDTPISTEAATCPNCGKPIYGDEPPKSWLVESILVTLFCCLPFGIVGIINAAKVESNWYAGRKEIAITASNNAKKWMRISLICGLIIGAFYLLYFILVGSLLGVAASAC